MLWPERGFTVIQFIVFMTVVGLLLMGVFVGVAKQVGRDGQRRSDLAAINAMIQRYAENHHGRYPGAKEADDPGSDLRAAFESLRLLDPKSGDMYVLGSSFDDCRAGADATELGPGYMSYTKPGINGDPYKLRVCLERGEYYFGD